MLENLVGTLKYTFENKLIYKSVKRLLVMAKKLWCECQLYAIKGENGALYAADENAPGAIVACGAHLAEGRAFECRRNPEDVEQDVNISSRNGLFIEGDPDFVPLETSVDMFIDIQD